MLSIEDNPDNTAVLRLMLADWANVSLLSSERAEEGIALAQSLQPDLILMDLSLPGMVGTEAMRRLKHDDRTSAIPVVAVTARAMSHEIAEGLAAGFDDYITKPFDDARLDEALNRFLARA